MQDPCRKPQWGLFLFGRVFQSPELWYKQATPGEEIALCLLGSRPQGKTISMHRKT